jgi:DNA-directed RNA polymerase subunit M/transcription elongation factor TFIIS
VETKLYTEKILKPKPTLVITSHLHAIKKLCPKCRNSQAYFWGSGRSKENAPEPSNTFYKCTKCGHTWKEI